MGLTDNPAWIYYDIVTADRFGLGNRLSSANISKWTLYQIAQYCDQLVPDGRGGDGMEPRYTCNVYVQERNDAYTVLRDFAAIFRGMTCWNGEQIVVQADMPRDVDFTYTRANIIGKPRYSSSSSQVRYTNALVSCLIRIMLMLMRWSRRLSRNWFPATVLTSSN